MPSQEGDMAQQFTHNTLGRNWSLSWAGGMLCALVCVCACVRSSGAQWIDAPVDGQVAPADASLSAVEEPRRSKVESRNEGLPLGIARPTAGSAVAADQQPSTPGWVKTSLALFAVVALILVVRVGMVFVARKQGGFASALGAGGRAPSGVVEILGRFPVARGQQFVLLRMDRRVLLLAQGPRGFQTLSEVTDADEVASILLKTRDDEGATNAAKFTEMLRRMENDPSVLSEDSLRLDGASVAGPTGLIDRLRGGRSSVLGVNA